MVITKSTPDMAYRMTPKIIHKIDYLLTKLDLLPQSGNDITLVVYTTKRKGFI